MQEKSTDILFEVSWEVCNKVGGIYTVVESKIIQILENYDEQNYYLVGPYFANKQMEGFIEKAPPDKLVPIFEALKSKGLICHFGKWLTQGEPQVILIDTINFLYKKDEIKTDFWNTYKIDSLFSEFYDYDQPLIWSVASGILIEEFAKKSKQKIVVQAHEWLSGGTILHLKKVNSKVATVFTTHATVLGRTLSMNDVNFYKDIKNINPQEQAKKYNIITKFQTERESAKACDIFTTVSEITALEAQYFLDRKADVLLPNGLDIEKFPTYEEAAIKHQLFRNKIREFLVYYFFPYYTFNLEHSLIYFISGRYEFHNKGIDIFIDALSMLNNKLKQENSQKTIIAFFYIPRQTIRIKPNLLENRAYYEDIRDILDEVFPDVKNRIMRDLVSRSQVNVNDLFEKDTLFEINKRINLFLKKGNPPLCTHDIESEQNDQIISNFTAKGLLNRSEDRVKVVFYPIYLNGADRLLDLNYQESMMGCHLGVFPSYYEPWGYTPLESAALGVSSVTTDLGGFGRYVKPHLKEKNPGIFVIDIFEKNWSQGSKELFNVIYNFSKLSREDRVKNKIEAKNVSSLVDWKNLIQNYISAHSMAINKAYKK